jgi:hypothetical protein
VGRGASCEMSFGLCGTPSRTGGDVCSVGTPTKYKADLLFVPVQHCINSNTPLYCCTVGPINRGRWSRKNGVEVFNFNCINNTWCMY